MYNFAYLNQNISFNNYVNVIRVELINNIKMRMIIIITIADCYE